MPKKRLQKLKKTIVLYIIISLLISLLVNILIRYSINRSFITQKEEIELIYKDIFKILIEEEFNPDIFPNYRNLSEESKDNLLKKYFSQSIFSSQIIIDNKIFSSTFNLQDFFKKLAKNNIRYNLYIRDNNIINHNSNLLGINSQGIEFSNGLKLNLKLDNHSSFLIKQKNKQEQLIFWLNLFTIIAFIILIIGLLTRKINLINLEEKIANLEQGLLDAINAKQAMLKFNEINRQYITNCYNKSKDSIDQYKTINNTDELINQTEYLPLPLETKFKNKFSSNYVIDLEPLITKLINYFEGYKIISNTLINLTIRKSESKFCSPYNKELFYQIIISFFSNILYFHKDTKNKKDIKIIFNECSVICSSNGVFLENDLAIKYSQKIFYETANLFILSLGQIFVLLNDHGLEYQVYNESQGTKIELKFKPKQKKIKLNTKKESNNIINFKQIK